MFPLDASAAANAHGLYQRHPAYFPLIGAVLLGTQSGLVLGDHPTAPSRFYVEHAFGFAQLFGAENLAFDEALRTYLVIDKAFATPKARLYTPDEPAFLRDPRFATQRSERQRFILPPDSGTNETAEAESGIIVLPVTADQITRIDQAFGVVLRFWRETEDFVVGARAIAAWQDDLPVAICYAAAVAAGLAEIDVLTNPDCRRQGVGLRVVQAFNARCRSEGLSPVWDCFTNNAGSMGLCRAAGFVAGRPPYPFYTLTR